MVQADFTLDAFPVSEGLKNQCSLPFGLTVQPFARVPQIVGQGPKGSLSEIARCSECYSYINAYCERDTKGFTCSLCGCYTPFPDHLKSRYCTRLQSALPEVSSNLVVFKCEESIFEEEEGVEAENEWLPPDEIPVYIALVDTACSPAFLDCVKTSLSAALEGLPASALFGLISFDDTVRLFDMKGAVPACRSIAVMDDGPLLAQLEDIMPLQRLLTPVGKYKDSILVALETLEARQSQPEPDRMSSPALPDQPSRDVQPTVRGQCFGTVIEGVLQYLGPFEVRAAHRHLSQGQVTGKKSQTVRVLSFLNSSPSLGHGSLTSYHLAKESMAAVKHEHSEPKNMSMTLEMATSVEMELGAPLSTSHPPKSIEEKAQASALSLVSSFYNQAALVAASMGVTFDLFGVSTEPIGLEAIGALAWYTGGGIWNYGSITDAMMAQDLHRLLSTPCARSCLLRVRMPPDLKISHFYGQLFKDPVHEDVFHILNCDPFETVAFDFQYTQGGFDYTNTPPVLQIAFQYTVPLFDGADLIGLERQMRICTLEARLARSVAEVHSGLRSSAVACLLLHKSMAAAKTEGRYRAALLLQDWMVIQATSYIQNLQQKKKQEEDTVLPFDGFESLQLIPRLVYGLLRSELLLGGCINAISDDELVFREHLLTSLPPSQLQRAVYPSLSSYFTPDKEALPLHSLSGAAVDGSDSQIFLLDAFTTVLVYFKAACPPGVYPPPVTSLLRSTVNDMRHNRRLAPQYKAIREGEPEEALFRSFMCDEPVEMGLKLNGEAAAPFAGYKMYREWLQAAAEKLMGINQA